jgi:hypothetical protein
MLWSDSLSSCRRMRSALVLFNAFALDQIRATCARGPGCATGRNSLLRTRFGSEFDANDLEATPFEHRRRIYESWWRAAGSTKFPGSRLSTNSGARVSHTKFDKPLDIRMAPQKPARCAGAPRFVGFVMGQIRSTATGLPAPGRDERRLEIAIVKIDTERG